jgi:outer membrane protein assembly factor BamB
VSSTISWRALATLVALPTLGGACGRTDLESWTTGTPTTNGSAAASGGGADTTSSAGATSSGPDFDFTPVPDQATTYQVHPSHSGSQQSATVTPPLVRLWSQHFAAAVSYPVMADGRVFVSVNPSAGSVGPIVRGFDAASGSTLWTSESIRSDAGMSPVHLTLDRGALFAANRAGAVLAFDTVTGNVLWRAQLPGVNAGGGSLPLAAGGAVFVGAAVADHYELFALDERDGHVVYSIELDTGGDPTLGEGNLFLSVTCGETTAVNAATGATVWQTSERCAGGPARSMNHGGILWASTEEGGLRALDQDSGATLGTLDEPDPPFMLSAAQDEIVLPSLTTTSALRVFGETSGAFRWQVALPAPPVLPALATPDTIYVLAGSADKFLCGIDLPTRQFAGQSSEPAAPDDDWSPTDADPVQAMAASSGRIVVAYGRWLSTFAAGRR